MQNNKLLKMRSLSESLSIVIATFNHQELLSSTLHALLKSPVRDCRITVLNNKSTDGTLSVCENFKKLFKRLDVYTQPVNLGGGSENYIHGIEFCDTEYIWHLADDDQYDFTYFSDVEDAILSGRYDLIQVGAHQEGKWDWGVADTPRHLCEKGYKYFRFSSFLPCDIFRYSYYTKYIKEAYSAISLWYPHMPCLIHAYNDDIQIYVSKRRIVTAIIGHQSYNTFVPRRGFIILSDMLQTKEDKRRCIESQITDSLDMAFLKFIYYGRIPNNAEKGSIYKRLYNVLSLKEKIVVIAGYLPATILRAVRCRKKRRW